MSTITKNYTYSTGSVIVAAEQNANLDTIYSDYNGNIGNVNISGTAAIAYSKLALTGGIVNSDINASAAIADSKLAQITTASKVSGTAITGLASLPAGAGIVPVANLGTGTPTAATALLGNGTWGSTGAITLISNTSMSAVTNSGDIAITNTNYYFVTINVTAMSGNDGFALRFNNDTNNHYASTYRGFTTNGTASNYSTGTGITDSMIKLCATGNQTLSGYSYNAYFYIYPQVSGGGQSMYIKGSCFGFDMTANVSYGSSYDDFGLWYGSAAGTSFRFLTQGGATMTGNVCLYKIATA